METFNNATNAVKTAIWGDNANTTTTGSSTTGTTTGSSSEVHKSMIDDSVTETKYSGKFESDPEGPGSYQAGQQRDTDRRPDGPTSTGGEPQGANLTNQQNTNQNPFSNSNEPNTGFGGAGAQPSVTADPNSGQQNTQKHQGADRPNEEPGASTGSGESGAPGPKSNMGGGTGGMKLPDSDNQSKGEGTGTKYEKSTGLHADGGDFDATRPGAAREADRLMEEKGIKHGEANPDGASGDADKKEKKWYGVDHSGFGGHGSHTNPKRGSTSSASGETRADTETNRTDTYDRTDTNRPETYNRPDTYDTNTTNTSNTTSHTTQSTYTDDSADTKVGLGQKVKDKLSHHH